MKTLAFPIVQVISDNFNGYMTKDAYREFRLLLSTGDFHMHTHAEILSIDPMSFAGTEYLYDTAKSDDFELIEIGMVKDFVKGKTK